MKRIAHFLILCLLVVCTVQAQKAKYVFYFIGDGMGVNQVNGTEMYLASLEDRIGTQSLLFTSFPVASVATTFSATHRITDSAASGTALATGTKTYNSAIGLNENKENVYSIAARAKASGKKVGVTTTVSIDHATPAAFYAHQASRKMYHEIALDLPKAGFDFYAGSGFLKPHTSYDKKEVPSIYPVFEEAGYTLAKGMDEFHAKAKDAQKMILTQKEGCPASALPFAIDRQEGDMTLKDITESAISFLTKGKNKGFFLMVEGGEIDWACHSNDAACAFNEVIDFDNAIKVAYDFYLKHPKETLIVITADHETGGFTLGNRTHAKTLKSLKEQKGSVDALSKAITDLRKEGKKVTWEDAKELLSNFMGFWTVTPLSWEQERALHDAFDSSFVKNKVVFEESLYARTEQLAAVANRVMSEVSMVGWTTGGHTAGFVPVYAIGAGSQLFNGKMDNTDIPKRIAQIAGYK